RSARAVPRGATGYISLHEKTHVADRRSRSADGLPHRALPVDIGFTGSEPRALWTARPAAAARSQGRRAAAVDGRPRQLHAREAGARPQRRGTGARVLRKT